MDKIDLSLLVVRRAAAAAAAGGGGAGAMCASCGTPKQVISVSSADGASCGYNGRLHHAWSQMRGMLAMVNSRSELIILQKQVRGAGFGTPSLPLRTAASAHASHPASVRPTARSRS